MNTLHEPTVATRRLISPWPVGVITIIGVALYFIGYSYAQVEAPLDLDKPAGLVDVREMVTALKTTDWSHCSGPFVMANEKIEADPEGYFGQRIDDNRPVSDFELMLLGRDLRSCKEEVKNQPVPAPVAAD